ncbi:MAG: ABC transporter substrate-binding protein [Actinomycetota bacterium]|nr:ABC transporter substrate-binding protein [Actinomycetota bacterium]MDQ3573700.1 ABC transporter substrate-binding protein [Actinomycetota bacterium]
MRKLVVICLALLLVTAACSGDEGAGGGGDQQGQTGGGQEPVRGGTLVVGLSAPLPAQNTLNPAVNTQGGMQQAAGHLFSGLVEIDEKARPVPELATKWDIREDGRIYEFTLADGVKWHDGQPLTAADVKFSYDAALLRNHARTQSSIGPALAQPCAAPPAPPSCPSIEAVEATGGQPAKVVFRFAQPYAPLLQQLTHTDGAIIPKHVWVGKPPPTAATPWPPGQNPVGTGPFKFVSHDASEIVYERNPDYFRKPLPYLDRMVQRAIPTPGAQVQALTAGEVDWLGNVRGQDLAGLRSNPNVEVDTGSQSAGGSTNCVLKLAFNLAQEGVPPAQVRQGPPPAHPILGDLRVRQAIAHGLKLDEYVDNVLQNDGGRVATGPVHSAMAWARADQPIPRFDAARAGRLLDDAGWTSPGAGQTRTKSGQQLSIDMYHFAGNEAALGTKIRQDLAPLGINVELRLVDPAGKNALYSARNFDTIVVSNCQATDPEIGVRRFYHSSAITGAPFTNGAGYKNTEVDQGFEQAAQQLGEGERGPIYQRVQQQIAKDLPYLWLLETVSNRAYTAKCEGLKPYTGHFAEGAFCRR